MTTTATYSFTEAVERIGQCTEYDELRLLATVLFDEAKKYSPYQFQLICAAISIIEKVVVK